LSRDVLARHGGLKRFVYRLMDTVANRAPMPVTRVLAQAVGTTMWALDARGRAAVRRNLAHFIPAACGEARSRAVLAAYRSFAVQLSEGFRLGRLPERYLERLRLVDPWQVFAQRPLRGPAILVTVHANWELMLAAVQRLRLIEQVEAISLSHGDPRIDHLFERKRGQVGCRSLLLDRAPLAALRSLKAERILGILADRDYTGNGVRVPFAGEPLSLPPGPAALSVQTGAPVVPMLLLRTAPSAFAVVVAKPLRADESLPKPQQVLDLTDRLAKTLVRFIATAPTQWVSFHDAWRNGAAR
jgi:KDO2-lipid IV(A) lauroyltransferase